MNGDGSFAPVIDGPTALFLDTSGLFAYFHPNAVEHTATTDFLKRVGQNELPYRPLLTSTYVLDELVTLLRSKGTHELAVTALARTLDSDEITVIEEQDAEFTAAREQFEQYDDHDISFTDHLNAVQMKNRNVEHIFAYDGDFETLGMTRIPR